MQRCFVDNTESGGVNSWNTLDWGQTHALRNGATRSQFVFCVFCIAALSGVWFGPQCWRELTFGLRKNEKGKWRRKIILKIGPFAKCSYREMDLYRLWYTELYELPRIASKRGKCTLTSAQMRFNCLCLSLSVPFSPQNLSRLGIFPGRMVDYRRSCVSFVVFVTFSWTTKSKHTIRSVHSSSIVCFVTILLIHSYHLSESIAYTRPPHKYTVSSDNFVNTIHLCFLTYDRMFCHSFCSLSIRYIH